MTGKHRFGKATDSGSLSLYLHVPFCRRRCSYCDFNTYAGLEALFSPYMAALTEQVRRTGRGEPVATVFFGGGTPSILPVGLVEDVLVACHDVFDVHAGAEITLEANPGTLAEIQLVELHRIGINRLSFGVQSFHADELALLGRLHTFEQAREAFSLARTAGFENLSLDLIYGLPDQTLEKWERTLEAALALSPDHISAYCLTIEEGTPLIDWVDSGHANAPDPDLAAQMYELAEQILEDRGLFHYEISNWAKPGRECLHNLVYWRDGDYVGFGAGAHSHRKSRRWWNVSTPAEYIARLRAGETPEADGEEINPSLAMGEMMMLGLRLSEGVSADAFRERFGRELDDVYGQELADLMVNGLVEWDGLRVRLTARGRLLGNQVFARFLPE